MTSKNSKNECYIKATTFEDFKNNQDTLIDVLNHKMTTLSTDVKWMKNIGYYMATVITGIAIKSIFFA